MDTRKEEMYRSKIEELKQWKASKKRKPLILNGARQVGKTWLLKEFGKICYESVAYVNLDGNKQMADLFNMDFDVERIVNGLELYTGIKIVPEKTLLILDEIQKCPKALHALKYFYENAPSYHVAVAGSLLGLSLSGEDFPVGKVNTKNLYPLSFTEFLRAAGKAQYAEKIESRDIEALAPFHDLLIDQLKTYLVVGGMPEVVKDYIDEGNLLNTRDIQREIVEDYEADFAKHAPINVVPKIREIFRILPHELAKENKKFLFSMIKSGARATDYEAALLWLEDAGIVTRVKRVETYKVPLTPYEEKDAFKLYLVDVGLLGAMSGLDPRVILDGDKLFTEFRGALAEQYAFQELTSLNLLPIHFYKKDKPSREVDFLIENGTDIIPIEVKSGEKTYSKSLGEFIRQYLPERAVKLSLAPYRPREKGSVEYIPLYAVPSLLLD